MPPAPHALVLAAGYGLRLRPITETTPKCMVEIGGRPLLDHWVHALLHAGVRRAVVNTHHLPEPVAAYARHVRETTPLELHDAFEETLLGSGGTLARHRDLADGTDCVVIVYADNLSAVDLRALVAEHRAQRHPFTMALFRAENPRACGIATLADDGTVTAFTEKPEQPASDLANAGVYVLDADAYREAADLGGADIGFDVLPRFVGRMHGSPIRGYHRDVGTLAALERARADFAAGLVTGGGA